MGKEGEFGVNSHRTSAMLDFAGGALNPAFDQRVAAPLWNPRVRFPSAELGGIKSSKINISYLITFS
jgi:hypothetical protein